MSAVISFNVAAFRAAFPAFANATTYPDPTLTGYWNAATCYISPVVYGRLQETCRGRALDLMTAHLAALADLIAAGEQPGIITSATIDKISVAMEAPPSDNQWQYWLNLTPYGQQLLALLQVKSSGGFYIGGVAERSGFRRAFGGFNGPRNY